MGLARKKSYGCHFGSSCRKVMVVFEKEKTDTTDADATTLLPPAVLAANIAIALEL